MKTLIRVFVLSLMLATSAFGDVDTSSLKWLAEQWSKPMEKSHPYQNSGGSNYNGGEERQKSCRMQLVYDPRTENYVHVQVCD